MSILVTGAAGEIGTNLCLYFLKAHEKVIGIDNFITGSKKNSQKLLDFSDFTFFEQSIESEDLSLILSKNDIKEVYHLACPTGVPNLQKIPKKMLLATSIGTNNILKIALQKKAKVLLASSSEIYGNPKEFPQEEEYNGNVDPLGIRAPYEEGKRFSETLAMTFACYYGLDVRILRIFNTFGPYSSNFDERVVCSFFIKALRGEPLIIYGDGSQKRTFLYVDDLIRGMILVMNKALPTTSVYNIGSEQEISILDLAHLILDICKSKSKIIFEQELKQDPLRRLPAIDKIKSLGWKQEISLEDGLKKFLESLS